MSLCDLVLLRFVLTSCHTTCALRVEQVTETDQQCEALVFEALRVAFPGHSFIGAPRSPPPWQPAPLARISTPHHIVAGGPSGKQAKTALGATVHRKSLTKWWERA